MTQKVILQEMINSHFPSKEADPKDDHDRNVLTFGLNLLQLSCSQMTTIDDDDDDDDGDDVDDDDAHLGVESPAVVVLADSTTKAIMVMVTIPLLCFKLKLWIHLYDSLYLWLHLNWKTFRHSTLGNLGDS